MSQLRCIDCGYAGPYDEVSREGRTTSACPECDGHMERFDVDPAYEDAYADLDDKAILLGILAELGAIRAALTGPQREGNAETYRCTFCGHGVAADARERHLRDEHDGPPGVDVGEVFEEV